MGSYSERLERAADARLAREHRNTERKSSTMNLSSIIGTSRREWTKESFSQPMPLSPGQLTPLGTDRDGTRQWYTHSKWGELAERPHLIDENREILPDGPILQESPGLWRTFDGPFAPGTFERLAATGTPIRKPKPPKPHRPVDALALVWLAAPVPELIVAPDRPRGFVGPAGVETPFAMKAAQPAARGAAAIIARLNAKGATVALSADRQYLVVTCADGRPGPGIVELVDTARPLILAYLQGTPLRCVVTKHKGEAPEAITFAVGGAPWCGECGEAKS